MMSLLSMQTALHSFMIPYINSSSFCWFFINFLCVMYQNDWEVQAYQIIITSEALEASRNPDETYSLFNKPSSFLLAYVLSYVSYPNHSLKQMGRKGVERHEPVSVSVLEKFPEFNACQDKFKGTWYQFFQKFQGYEDEITLYFTQGCDTRKQRLRNTLLMSET